jgi:hypothetical protein
MEDVRPEQRPAAKWKGVFEAGKTWWLAVYCSDLGDLNETYS